MRRIAYCRNCGNKFNPYKVRKRFKTRKGEPNFNIEEYCAQACANAER